VELLDSFSLTLVSSNTVETAEIHRLQSPNEKLAIACKTQEEWSQFRTQILNNNIIPYLDALDESSALLLIQNHLGEDHHWDWQNKALQTYCNSSYDWFVLNTPHGIQGLLLTYHPTHSDVESGNVFYIDFLASAPWNRETPSNQPRLRGVGSGLVIS